MRGLVIATSCALATLEFFLLPLDFGAVASSEARQREYRAPGKKRRANQRPPLPPELCWSCARIYTAASGAFWLRLSPTAPPHMVRT